MHCGQAHWSSRCKSLGIPPEGFSKENGGGGHDHGDDEEDKMVFRIPNPSLYKSNQIKTTSKSKDVAVL
jgi:hypothetical protein